MSNWSKSRLWLSCLGYDWFGFYKYQLRYLLEIQNEYFLVRHRKNKLRTTEPAPVTVELPPVLYSAQGHNLSSLLGDTSQLKCTVLGYKPEEHTVSWTRTTVNSSTPTALTFGSQVVIAALCKSVCKKIFYEKNIVWAMNGILKNVAIKLSLTLFDLWRFRITK